MNYIAEEKDPFLQRRRIACCEICIRYSPTANCDISLKYLTNEQRLCSFVKCVLLEANLSRQPSSEHEKCRTNKTEKLHLPLHCII